MARLTAEKRERAIGMIQLAVSYAHVARILNCTKLTITSLIQHYRTAERHEVEDPTSQPTRTAISAPYTSIIDSSPEAVRMFAICTGIRCNPYG